MKRVAASEHDLIRVGWALVGAAGAREAEALLREKRDLPKTIGETAAGLLRDTVTRGAVRELVRRGGWRSERRVSPRQDGLAEGPLWDRHPPLALRFGPASFRLLRWLVSEAAERPRRRLGRPRDVTAGDDLLAYLACDLLGRLELPVRADLLRRSPLCWLGFTDLLSTEDEEVRFDFAPLLHGDGAVVLEALQADLARRWTAIERGKAEIVDLAKMTRLGAAQERVLDAFLDAADAAGRRDLAGFLVEAAEHLLAPGPTSRLWIRRLNLDGRPVPTLAARQAAYDAASAYLRRMARLDGWRRELGQVRFFDEGYDVAQSLLSAWEGLGDDGFQRLAELAAELDVSRQEKVSEDAPAPAAP